MISGLKRQQILIMQLLGHEFGEGSVCLSVWTYLDGLMSEVTSKGQRTDAESSTAEIRQLCHKALCNKPLNQRSITAYYVLPKDNCKEDQRTNHVY